ncbi:bacteriocin leader domain-containing protein [Clostridium botulinum]|nr:bacteriocin leader domain-containing protein [Clostridium botulinum]
MKNFRGLNLKELQEVSGGKVTKYPNGVSCDSDTGKCSVDWSEARAGVGQIVVNGWLENGPWAHR